MFRFSIRDVLWLVVVGLACGWAVDHFGSQDTATELRAVAMEEALKSEGFTIEEKPFSVLVKNAAGSEYEVSVEGGVSRKSARTVKGPPVRDSN
jgi:hypothetical protein